MKISGHRRSRTASARNTFHVVPDNGLWVVTSGGDHARSVYKTKDEAVDAAKAAIQSSGGMLWIRDGSGRITENHLIGRKPFARISAVEGISPTEEANDRAVEFERRGLLPEERRLAIINAHRPRS